MVTLVSPGVDVSVIDESFYATSGTGTVPLIVIATAQDKPTPSVSADIARGTRRENSERLYLITSQRELVQTFGEPIFYTSNGTPVHGSELNEYGLFAAYSYLGVANRAYVVRADVDLSQLVATTIEPRGTPLNGTNWFDLFSTRFGVFQSNGSSDPSEAWESRSVTIINSGAVPNDNMGDNGNLAIVTTVDSDTGTSENSIWEKINGSWEAVDEDSWKSSSGISVTGSAIILDPLPRY